MVRQLALFDVWAAPELRGRVVEIAAVFRGRVIDATPHTMVIEVSGIPAEIDALEDLLGDFGLRGTQRTEPLPLPSRRESTHSWTSPALQALPTEGTW